MSKLIGNQEFDGQVFIRGVGGYNGQQVESGNDLETHLDTTDLSADELNYIFGITSTDLWTDYIVDFLYIDDFPGDMIEDIIERADDVAITYGSRVHDLEEYVNFCIQNPTGAIELRTNVFCLTPEKLVYEGEVYRVYVPTYIDNSGDFLSGSGSYALLPENLTYEELYQNSMEADVNNAYCPFALLHFNGSEGIDYEANSHSFRLVYAHKIDKTTNPINTEHSETINAIYTDSFHEFGIYADMYNVAGGVAGDMNLEYYLGQDGIRNYGEYQYMCYWKLPDSITYEGEEYAVWVNNEDWGVLAPIDLTYSDVYPHTIEADSMNYLTPYCPFVAIYNNADESVYDSREPIDKYNVILAID